MAENEDFEILEDKNHTNENKLFENFVVIGPNQNNIENLDFENNEITMVEPSVIFDFNVSNAILQSKFLFLIIMNTFI